MAKTTVEDCKRIKTWWLRQHGYFLDSYRAGGIEWKIGGSEDNKSSIGVCVNTQDGYIRFHYTQTDYWSGEKSDMDYRFNLATSPCHYGGFRYWFICGLSRNGQYCGQRVGVLYKPPGAKWFGCRHCWDLSYDERNKSYGGIYGGACRTISQVFKADELREKIKRWYWKGKPTRKHLRWLKYAGAVIPYDDLAL